MRSNFASGVLLLALVVFLALPVVPVQSTSLDDIDVELDQAKKIFVESVMKKPEKAQETYLALRNVRPIESCTNPAFF